MNKLEKRVFQILKEEDEKDNAPSFGLSDNGSEETSDNNENEDGNVNSEEPKDTESDQNAENEDSNADGNESDTENTETEKNDNDEDKDGLEHPKSDDVSDDENTDDGNDEKSYDKEYDSYDDFLKDTETKCKITLISTEPSPIFGPKDMNDHNKYKITLTNPKGSVWFYFWDSINNTKAGNVPTTDDVMECFTLDVNSVYDGMSLDEFKETFGYGDTDNGRVQKAYDGCRKMVERSKKLFDDESMKKLVAIQRN